MEHEEAHDGNELEWNETIVKDEQKQAEHEEELEMDLQEWNNNHNELDGYAVKNANKLIHEGWFAVCWFDDLDQSGVIALAPTEESAETILSELKDGFRASGKNLKIVGGE